MFAYICKIDRIRYLVGEEGVEGLVGEGEDGRLLLGDVGPELLFTNLRIPWPNPL